MKGPTISEHEQLRHTGKGEKGGVYSITSRKSTSATVGIYGNIFQEQAGTPNRRKIPTREEILHLKERNKYHYDIFRETLQYLLLWGQFWGLNPVLGVMAKDPSDVRFSWKSLKVLYSVFLATAQFGVSCVCLFNLFSNSLSIDGISFFFFCFSTFLISLSSIRTATKWPALVKELSTADLEVNPKIICSCKLIVAVFISIAIVEHSLSVIKNVTFVLDCLDPNQDLYEGYIQKSFSPLFKTGLPYHIFVGICLEFMIIVCTFNWNYSDVFIVIISIYLTSVLEELNKKVTWASRNEVSTSSWRDLREAYTRATRLVRVFDQAINNVIFVSFATSLFFVCLQLFNILANGMKGDKVDNCPNFPSGPFNGYERSIYYSFSLLAVLARTISVALLAAKVHSESRSVLPALYSVSPQEYHEEVQRFIEQVHGDTVSLTGLNFFNMTRDLVLTVAGTIVTYELVLLQFKGEDMINS